MTIEISTKELQERLERGDPISLIDCREPWEFELVRLENALLIPMNDTPAHLEKLRSLQSPIVIYCHHGIRSMHVAQWLRAQGLTAALSLAGGIDAWSLQVDPDLPRY